ncbi:MAG: MBL fold metallo-hydrolase [Ilumatobacteraceae bacterium]
MTAITVTLLGTGSPLPDPTRAGPSTLVKAGNTYLLIDCGRGVAMRLMGAGVPIPFIDTVLITHLHSDHITDLNDIMTTRWIMTPAATPLNVYGPPGTQHIVDSLMEMLRLDRGYRTEHHEDLRKGPGLQVQVTEVSPGESFTISDVLISVHKTDHRPVTPSVGYRIEHGGSSVAIAGDTVPCAELDVMCRDTDIYVQTVVRPELVAQIAQMFPVLGSRFTDILDYHSSVEQAAQTATRANVKKLAMTHYVPAIQPGAEHEWIEIAAAHFSGEIIVGPDLTSIDC